MIVDNSICWYKNMDALLAERLQKKKKTIENTVKYGKIGNGKNKKVR